MSLPRLLKVCKKVGIHFNTPYDILDRVWDNLNLVVHLGMRLPTSILWSMYFTAKGIKPVAKSKQAFIPQALKVMDELESENLSSLLGKTDPSALGRIDPR